MPPTPRTAKTASAITIAILTKNWKTSVTSTPHNPDMVEMNDVSAINPMTIASACTFVMPSVSIAILTIARFTQPRMMQLIGMPR